MSTFETSFILDKEICNIIQEGQNFVFSPFQLNDVNDLLNFENRYCQLSSKLDLSYADEWYDFHECEMSLLGKRPFSSIARLKEDETYKKMCSYNLDDIEICILRSYLQQVSGMYRPDAYHYGLPPFAEEIIKRLQVALKKLPRYGDATLVRQLNEYDSIDLSVNDILSPCYCLTTSANDDWKDGKGRQYVIRSLPNEYTKARSIVFANSYEQQVTFLIGARFRIDEICVSTSENCIIYMHEIL